MRYRANDRGLSKVFRTAMATTLSVAKILIVDDHPLVREGLTILLNAHCDLEVCGEASDESGAFALFREQKPDLTIVDVSLASGQGINLIKQILACDPQAKTLVVSGYDESLYAERSLRAGACGYLNKQELIDKIIDMVRAILEGKRFPLWGATDWQFPPSDGVIPSIPSDPINRLTNREREIFTMIGHGQTSAEIASQLNLSVHTVDTHRERLCRKISAKSSAELIRRAMQWVLEDH